MQFPKPKPSADRKRSIDNIAIPGFDDKSTIST